MIGQQIPLLLIFLHYLGHKLNKKKGHKKADDIFNLAIHNSCINSNFLQIWPIAVHLQFVS